MHRRRGVLLRRSPRVNPPRLVVFARYPVPGKTKTRLIERLGAQEAAQLQDRMTRHTLSQADEFARRSGASVQVYFTGSDRSAMSDRYGDRFDYIEQEEGGLGERLTRAALAQDGSVIIIGSDCPGVTAYVLQQAAARLADHDLVLGPSLDGGYYLIGMRQPRCELFTGIDWSTDRVAAQTIDAAHRLGLTCALLERLSDIDRPEDLSAYPHLQ